MKPSRRLVYRPGKRIAITVARALQKQHPALHGITLQSVVIEGERASHQTVNGQFVARRINLRDTTVVALKVQCIWCNRAVEQLQRR